MKKIVVTVAPDGSSKVEAFGFTGSACLRATQDIERAIGKLEMRKAKPEGGTLSESRTQNQEG